MAGKTSPVAVIGLNATESNVFFGKYVISNQYMCILYSDSKLTPNRASDYVPFRPSAIHQILNKTNSLMMMPGTNMPT